MLKVAEVEFVMEPLAVEEAILVKLVVASGIWLG